jgi:hypothetical protein
MRDRIAVAFPRIGVKVWLWVKGTWQPQRSILRQNVTAIKFVGDGEALLGGTKDGVLLVFLLIASLGVLICGIGGIVRFQMARCAPMLS